MIRINLKIDREVDLQDHRLSAEKKLCYAMLERALYDVFSNSLSDARMIGCRRKRYYIVKSAYLWLMRDPIKRDNKLTAQMCCDALGVNLQLLRDKIAQHRKQPMKGENVYVTRRHGRQIKFVENDK